MKKRSKILLRLSDARQRVWAKTNRRFLVLFFNKEQAFVWLGGLLAVWTCAWVAVWPFGDFPLDDDWVYALAVRSILETGRFSLPSPATADVIAQAYWGALFCLPAGFSFDALRLSTFVLGGAGVLCLFMLVRELGGSRGTAAFAALSLAANPLYLGLSASFMTDVPFTAVSAASLWFHVRGVRRHSTAWLSAALAAALAAMLIRQFGLALFLAYGVGHLMRNRWSVRSWVFAATPVAAATLLQVGYEHWLVAAGRIAALPIPLPVVLPHAAPQAAVRIIRYGLKIFFYLGLCAAPFMLWLGVKPRRASLAGGGLLALVLVALMFSTNNELPRFGNTLIPSGMGPLTLRDSWVLGLNQPPVTAATKTVWLLLSVLSCAGTAAILVILMRTAAQVFAGISLEFRCRAAMPATMLVFIGTIFAGLMLIATLADPANVFDRYILPMIAPTYALVLMQRAPTTPRFHAAGTLAASVLLVCFAAGSLLAAHDYLAWNRARWQATNMLARAGVSPRRIDGGYEFNGWLLHAPDYVRKPGKSMWWVDDDEYVVASGPMNGYAEVARVSVKRWMAAGPAVVLVLHRVP